MWVALVPLSLSPVLSLTCQTCCCLGVLTLAAFLYFFKKFQNAPPAAILLTWSVIPTSFRLLLHHHLPRLFLLVYTK